MAKYSKIRHQTIIKEIRNSKNMDETMEEEIAKKLRMVSFPKTTLGRNTEVSPSKGKPKWLNQRAIASALSAQSNISALDRNRTEWLPLKFLVEVHM